MRLQVVTNIQYHYTFTKEEMIKFITMPEHMTRTTEMESLIRTIKTRPHTVAFEVAGPNVIVIWSEEMK